MSEAIIGAFPLQMRPPNAINAMKMVETLRLAPNAILSTSVSPNDVRLWAMVLLIGGERGQEDQKWQIIQTGLQTADFYVIKMCQN